MPKDIETLSDLLQPEGQAEAAARTPESAKEASLAANADTSSLEGMLAKADSGTRARVARQLQSERGNSFVQKLARKSKGRGATAARKPRSAGPETTVIKANLSVPLKGEARLDREEARINRQDPAAGPSMPSPIEGRYRPPAYAQAGRIGAGVIEDIGDTRALTTAIEGLLPAAFKGAGSSALSAIRAGYSNDNVKGNAQNLIQGAGLHVGPIIGQDSHDNWSGEVNVTGAFGQLSFDRADTVGPSTASGSTAADSGTGSRTTSVSGELSGGVKGGDAKAGGEASGGAKVGVGETNTTGTTAGMGGTTTRTVAQPPGSCLFSTTMNYSITVTAKREPRTGWNIASLGLTALYSAIFDEDMHFPGTASGAGVRVRFPGLDCPPE